MAKLIPLTQGKFAQVDDDLFEALSAFKWYALRNYRTFYAVRKVTIEGRRKLIYMHHEIMGKPIGGLEVDHKDRNGLNNQRDNLQRVTHARNALNNGATGVSWERAYRKWRAQIMINGTQINLGRFDDVNEAIQARETFKQNYLWDFPLPLLSSNERNSV